MKHMKTETVPASTRQVVAKVTCDICSKEVSERMYDVDEVTVSRVKGERYPDNGHTVELAFDLCGECFDTKLVPALKALGAEPRSEETEW